MEQKLEMYKADHPFEGKHSREWMKLSIFLKNGKSISSSKLFPSSILQSG